MNIATKLAEERRAQLVGDGSAVQSQRCCAVLQPHADLRLAGPEVVGQIQKVRRIMATMSPDRAMDGLLKLMAKHATNEELLNALPVR